MIIYGLATPADHFLILDSWARCFRKSPYSGVFGDDCYYPSMRITMYEAMSSPSSSVFVAKNSEGAPGLTDLLGYIVTERGWVESVREKRDGRWHKAAKDCDIPVVHFCYVKENYRKQGIGLKLLDCVGIAKGTRFVYTCRTRASDAIKSKFIASWDPDALKIKRGKYVCRTEEKSGESSAKGPRAVADQEC